MPEPPVIHLGEVLSTEPRLVAPGTPFRFLALDDDDRLIIDDQSPYVNQNPLHLLRDDYIDRLLDNGIEVLNDGSDPDFPNTFAQPDHPLRLIIKKAKQDVFIFAHDQTKDEGTTFTFAGTEFFAFGLFPGDTIVSVTLTSPGAPASAPAGEYPITPSNAIIDPAEHQDRYEFHYFDGTMTVIPACPWGEDETINVKFIVNYSEQTNPFNAVQAAPKQTIDGWAKNSTLSGTKDSNSVGDPFARGSTGSASGTVTVVKTSSTNIRVTATVTSMGLPMERLLDAQTQIENIDCESFLLGNGADFSWVAQYFGGFFIGVVMVFQIHVSYQP